MEETIGKIIHDEACWVLENVGVETKNKKVIDTFEQSGLAGYDSKNKRVYILKDLIKSSMENVPKRHKFPVQDNSFGGGGVAAFVKRGDDYITPITEIHVADIMNTAEEFNIPFMFKGVSNKFGTMEEEKQIEIMRKYYSGMLYVRAETRGGLEKCLEEYESTGKICTTHSILDSPLKINDTGNNVDNFFNAAEKGLPLYLTSMPMSCLTAPATIYGLTTLAYSEFLAGMVLSQIINPGVQVVNGAFPTITDVSKKYTPALGSLSHNMANYLSAKVSEVFGLPSIQSGNTISGEYHNPKNTTDYETERGYKFWNTVKDWHQVRHSFGFINNLIAYDMDKMQRDLRTLERVKSNNETIDINFDDIWYDSEACYAIAEGVEKGNFKDIYHTTKNLGVLDENHKNL
ncbi:MAG: trimethylamine methyltransferase family protein [archaeon]